MNTDCRTAHRIRSAYSQQWETQERYHKGDDGNYCNMIASAMTITTMHTRQKDNQHYNTGFSIRGNTTGGRLNITAY